MPINTNAGAKCTLLAALPVLAIIGTLLLKLRVVREEHFLKSIFAECYSMCLLWLGGLGTGSCRLP